MSEKREILGKARTVRELLNNRKYSIDYYQREYKWQTKQVSELIDDLLLKFNEDYDSSHGRLEVDNYGHYFLGSIIISHKNGKNFLIDGQQRMTTLSLLLIYLKHLSEEKALSITNLEDMIKSEKYGTISFNLDVPDRNDCMRALLENDQTFSPAEENEAVTNIWNRYQDFKELFPEELYELYADGTCALPYFVDWLIENVHLVEITAYSDADAYTVFETMNDRGLDLSPAEMLKGFLLAKISSEQEKHECNLIWREQINRLENLGRQLEDKELASDFFKSWLRSQYAQNIRQRKKGAKPEDWDRIGTEFHRWIREHTDDMGLQQSVDYVRFIKRDLVFYTNCYIAAIKASRKMGDELPWVFYNQQNNFTLQYPILLSALKPGDSEELIIRKMRIISRFIDILLHWRLWNFRMINYSTMQYAVFIIMKECRRKEPAVLVSLLKDRLNQEDERINSRSDFYVHQQNGRYVQRILARLTSYIESQSGLPNEYEKYTTSTGTQAYEVEHVLSIQFEDYQDLFADSSEYDVYRNRIGGLLLLPKTFNSSYGDMVYGQKRDHYNSQNILARTLHEHCYSHNPGFLKFKQESDLGFTAYETFDRQAIEQRQQLYIQLGEMIWNENGLDEDLEDE